MSKGIKIAGIVLVSLIVLTIFLNILFSASRGMLSGSSDFGGSSGMMEVGSLPGGSLSFGNKSADIRVESDSSMMSESAAPVNDIIATVDKKIIKNGSLNLKVDQVDEASERIKQIAKDNQGEIFSSNIRQSNKNIKSGSIIVKVPVANFEKSFAEIKTVASLVLSESTSGQDVTQEYVDLQGQLKNKQAEEQQFVEIMKQAQKIQDILDVTRQLSRVRGEIERLQGQLKFMDSQTDMSTISISLSEDQDITVVDSWRPWQVVKGSVNALFKNIQGSVNFIIKLVIVVLPIFIIWGLIIWAVYLIGKKIYFKIKK